MIQRSISGIALLRFKIKKTCSTGYTGSIPPECIYILEDSVTHALLESNLKKPALYLPRIGACLT